MGEWLNEATKVVFSRTLKQHGLIDGYHLVVSPVLLGSGKQLFSGLSKSAKLKLLAAKGFKSGSVMLRYARAKK